MRLRSIRNQLTLWYALVLLIGLSCFSIVSLLVLYHSVATSKNSTLLRREARLLSFLHLKTMSIDQQPLVERLLIYSQFAPEGDLLEVYDDKHKLLFPSAAPAPSQEWPQGECLAPCFGEMQVNGHRTRAIHQAISIDGQQLHLYLGGSMSEHDDVVDAYRSALLVLMPAIACLSIAGGYILSRRALRSLDRLTHASLHISIRSLSDRLPVPDTNDEIQRLAEAFNDLLDRLDSAVSKLTQFTADASHDLRTSITVMLATSQIALKRTRSESEYREALETVVVECQSTSHLLDDMLTLARADAFRSRILRERIDLRETVETTCRRMQTLASAKRQTFQCLLPSSATSVNGNGELLQRLAGILVDNAIKFTPNGGSVCVSLLHHPENAELRIEDNGIGIPPDLIPKVFDRFFRVDSSRSAETAGNGLGLSIAKWIADAHSATISVQSEPTKGTVFCVNFARV